LHLYHAHGQLLRLNLRQRQLTWEDGMVTLRGGANQIICLKMLLAKEGATVNFDRDFIPCWRCCSNETSPAYDRGNCEHSGHLSCEQRVL